MALQIHAVMQESEHVDDVALLNASNTEHDEVSALASISGNMKRPDIDADFRPLLGTNNRGAGA